jgi:hypothetical protein
MRRRRRNVINDERMTLAERVKRVVRQPPTLEPGEKFLDEARAVRTTAFPRTYGGRLYLTDRAVYFAPDVLNRLVGARPWCALWTEVRSADLGERRKALNGRPTPQLELVTTGSAETFTGLSDPERVIELLKRLVG